MRPGTEFKTSVKVAGKALHARPTESGVFLRKHGEHAASAEFIGWEVLFKKARSGRLLRERNERRRYRRLVRRLRAGDDEDGKFISEEDMFFIAHYQGAR